MLKYARIVNDKTKLCEVGTGTDTDFYESIGMTEMNVEQAYDGSWYLEGYAPHQSEKEKQLAAYQEELAKKEQWLRDHDYIGVKIATGRATVGDYAAEIATMTEYAARVEELRTLIANI